MQLSNKIKVNKDGDENHEESDDNEDDPFVGISQPSDNPMKDDEFYRRDDHTEGIWINLPFQDNDEQTTLNLRKKRRRM